MLFGLIINILLFAFVIQSVYSISKSEKLNFKWVFIVFIIKTIFGCLYGIIYAKSPITSDTWNYHSIGLTEYKWLQSNFFNFAADLFKHGYNEKQTTTFFNSDQSYWKDLPLNLLVKLLAIFNIISRGNYYLNVLLYNLLTLVGNLYLFKAICIWFPEKRKIAFTICCLFPPLLFWTSGIHKDGIVFTCTAVILYFISTKSLSIYQRIIGGIFVFALLFLFRNFVALSLMPWLIAFFISLWYRKKVVAVYIVTLCVGVLLFTVSSLGPSATNFPKKLQERQAQYLQLKGNSYMYTPSLTGSFKSYIQLLPIAINHAFCRPYFTESTGVLALISAIESYAMIAIWCVAIVFFRKQFSILQHPFLLLLLFFACTNYLLIGFTVPFTGAIVRYRVIFELFLLIISVLIIDSNQLISNQLNVWFRKKIHPIKTI